MGIPIHFTFERAGKRFGVYFKAGEGNYIEAFQVEKREIINTGIVHFCLETDNIDGFIADMTHKGVECTEKKRGSDRSWQTWLRDPDGNRIEIHEYTPESAQRLGGTVQVPEKPVSKAE
jgi:catechol 2,3-dioxygenase-like lactoylglutathione lyase family enzyme